MKKKKINDPFDFIFNDKYDIKENFFADYYNAPGTKNPRLNFKPKGIENIISAIFKNAWTPDDKETEHIESSSGIITWYGATYYHDIDSLNVRIVKPDNNQKVFDSKESWNIFYNYATFQEILESFEPMMTDDNLARFAAIRGNKSTRPEDVLSLIRDYPVVLWDETIRLAFTKILQSASWHPEKNKRRYARLSLKDHLIPQSKGGEIPLPPGYTIVMELMIKLANHLSDKCKSIVKFKRGINETAYKELITTAKKSKEYRISTLSLHSLDNLIFKTTGFAQSLLAHHLGFVSRDAFMDRTEPRKQ